MDNSRLKKILRNAIIAYEHELEMQDYETIAEEHFVLLNEFDMTEMEYQEIKYGKKTKMFRFTLFRESSQLDTTFDSVDEMADFVSETTGLWMLAKHIKEICNKMHSGDKWVNEDAGIIIECA